MTEQHGVAAKTGGQADKCEEEVPQAALVWRWYLKSDSILFFNPQEGPSLCHLLTVRVIGMKNVRQADIRKCHLSPFLPPVLGVQIEKGPSCSTGRSLCIEFYRLRITEV